MEEEEAEEVVEVEEHLVRRWRRRPVAAMVWMVSVAMESVSL